MTVLVSGDRTVPWASSLPVDRVLKPLKYEVAINRCVLPETTPADAPISYLDIGTVDSEGGIGTPEQLTFETAPSRARRVPSSGDTIISTVRTYLRAIAFLGSVEPWTVCSTGFAVLTPGARLHPKFLSYWLRSDFVVDEICARSTGISYPAINALEIGNLPVPILPVNKQRAIATFLDRKTAAIDTLIQKKERQIELLQEKRQALITQAVTKGLDPNVPMKNSGERWLGSVPEQWGVRALKWATRIKRGASPRPIDDPKYFDENGTHGWVRIEDVSRSSMYLKTTAQTLSRLGASLSVPLRNGQLFLSIAGTVGKPCIAATSCCIHDGFVYFPDWDGDSRFLYYIFASGEPYRGLGKLGTQLNLNTDTVGGIRIGLPSKAEQTLIADHLDRESHKIGETVRVVENQVEVLREYRQALISAAVTGKIEIPAEEAA